MVDKLLLLMPMIIIHPESEARKTNYNYLGAYHYPEREGKNCTPYGVTR